MAVQGDEVAERIEQQIRESIDRLVEELRTSVNDVREAVDQQLDAAIQSVQADVKSLSLRGIIEPLIRDAVAQAPETPFPAPAGTAAAPKGPDGAALRRAIRAVESGKSQVEILNALLGQALSFASRAALLILKGDSFAGWKGAGFAAFSGDDEAVKRLAVGPGVVPELDQLRTREQAVAWNGASFASSLGVTAPSAAIAIPMVIKDKIAAALYVDAMADDGRFDRASMEVLVFVTGLLIDTLAIRKKIPSPTLSADDQAPAEGGDVFTDAASPAAAAPAPAATVAVSPEIVRQAQEAAPRPAEPAAPRPVPPPAAPPAQPAAPPPSAPPAAEDRPSTQYVPPPEVAKAAATPVSEDAKKHDDAKRFARLLVSEIKLYNEAKVDQGRKNHDLYERLKEDVDRSRQMYDERVPEDVRKVSNYFYDELVRILADGNPDALGL